RRRSFDPCHARRLASVALRIQVLDPPAATDASDGGVSSGFAAGTWRMRRTVAAGVECQVEFSPLVLIAKQGCAAALAVGAEIQAIVPYAVAVDPMTGNAADQSHKQTTSTPCAFRPLVIPLTTSHGSRGSHNDRLRYRCGVWAAGGSGGRTRRTGRFRRAPQPVAISHAVPREGIASRGLPRHFVGVSLH